MAPHRFWSNITVTSSFDVRDRAIGVVLGGAAGDALGAGYEFQHSIQADAVTMRPGVLTGRPAGQWTDDTDMSLGIALAAQRHRGLDNPAARTEVAREFLRWFDSQPPDVGMQTRAVLRACRNPAELTNVAARYQAEQPDAAGNGSLMRTAVVALPHYRDLATVADVARRISALTHAHHDAQDACALWSMAVALGVQGSESPLESMDRALNELPTGGLWRERLDEAIQCDPRDLTPNGWVVRALQAAWRSVYEADPHSPFVDGVRYAVALGDDTDTIAAIAGGLLGAHFGANSIPAHWKDGLGGWPETMTRRDLELLALDLVSCAD